MAATRKRSRLSEAERYRRAFIEAAQKHLDAAIKSPYTPEHMYWSLGRRRS